MSDKEQSNREVEVEGTKPPTPMAETDQSQQQQQPQQSSGVNLEKMSRFSIWPPTQHTREAVIKRLVETLSTPSVLSKRYGSMPPEEASSAARQIEEEAYSAPSLAASSNTAEDDGIEILQLYSKEISKKMLETVKARAASVSSPDNPSKASDAATDVTAASATRPASEEISSAQTES
ncbi:MFP1 attachment factor 1-like [Macadamia integrifolia]|uniref:MFP1 attachment factor 1-like n=1 Tax=Macadamia integrifolia TaxID=60698 RepID=UPI001C4FE2FB|nr:MFP1 attachment factor 1-like [Macadamia integrifolia]